MIEIATVAWLVSGVWFWISAMNWSGWPIRWHSENNRQYGWDETLFIFLPLCALSGPVFWVLRAAYAVRR